MEDVETLRRHADALFKRGGGLVPPSDVILSWPAPNYTNPATHGQAGPFVVIAFLALSIAVYIARMWARCVMAKNHGLDDWIMTASIPPLIGAAVAVVLACRTYGFQWHAWDQTSETFVTTRQISLVIELLYLAATALIKISILFFYKRITDGSISKTFRYVIWGTIVFVIVYFFVFVFTIIFSCSPIEGYWHYFDIQWRLSHELKCHNEGAEIVAVVVISTLQDFYLCALPVFLIWNLQISRRQKFALCGIFGVGLLTCVCGFMRAYYAIYVYYYTYDITWYAWYGWIWTALEAQLGVICASAPALKGFFKHYFKLSSIRSLAYGSGKNNSTGRSSGYGKMSGADSTNQSNTDGSRWEPEPIPLNRIKASTHTDVVVENRVMEDRDDVVSQGSASSTRNLTAMPITPASPSSVHMRHPRESDSPYWSGNQTVISTFRPSEEHDVEKHAPGA